jgi:dolichyl-phosphate-mannose--protein O-mannosyl transferase
VKDGLYSLAPLLLAPIAVYVACWTGWFLSDGIHAYNHDAFTQPNQSWLAHDLAVLHGWWDYQKQIAHFSATLDAGHPYRSRPWGWLLMTRPIAYFFQGSPQIPPSACGLGKTGSCAQEIIAIGNPAIWWASIVALLACAWQWLGRRDWRGLAVLLPFLVGYVPWCILDIRAVPNSGGLHRTMFFYYMVPEIPFIVLSVTFAVGLMLGRRRSREGRLPSVRRRTTGLVAATAYLGLVVGVFAYFYPVLSAKIVTDTAYRDRLWFDQCSNASPTYNKGQTQENSPCWF